MPDAGEPDRRLLVALREDLRDWVTSHADVVPASVATGVAAAGLVVSVVDSDLVTTSPTPFGRLVAYGIAWLAGVLGRPRIDVSINATTLVGAISYRPNPDHAPGKARTLDLVQTWRLYVANPAPLGNHGPKRDS